MIRVLIVELVAETRLNLQQLIAAQGDMEVVGVFDTLDEVFDIDADVMLLSDNVLGWTQVREQTDIGSIVVIGGDQGNRDIARRINADAFVMKPLSFMELCSIIRRKPY